MLVLQEVPLKSELGMSYSERLAVLCYLIAICKKDKGKWVEKSIFGFGIEKFQYHSDSIEIKLTIKSRWGSRKSAHVTIVTGGQTVFVASSTCDIIAPETKVSKYISGTWELEVLTTKFL